MPDILTDQERDLIAADAIRRGRSMGEFLRDFDTALSFVEQLGLTAGGPITKEELIAFAEAYHRMHLRESR